MLFPNDIVQWRFAPILRKPTLTMRNAVYIECWMEFIYLIINPNPSSLLEFVAWFCGLSHNAHYIIHVNSQSPVILMPVDGLVPLCRSGICSKLTYRDRHQVLSYRWYLCVIHMLRNMVPVTVRLSCRAKSSAMVRLTYRDRHQVISIWMNEF